MQIESQAIIKFLIGFVFFTHIAVAHGQKPNERLLHDHWTASWITHPDESTVEYGVFNFRKELVLDQVPEQFVVNLSADNRYKFFVNGKEVCYGPARGDLAHWYYETIDIAPYLRQGRNILAAVVWNFSIHRPWAQFSLQTAFVLQGNSSHEEKANTDNTWQVTKNLAYSPITDFSHLQTFIVVGPGEKLDASLYPWGWQDTEHDMAGWKQARQIVHPKPRGIGTDIDWVMTPRDIPLMENKPERLAALRRSNGIDHDASGIMFGAETVIPAGGRVSLLFDNGVLTKGYPVLKVSGGSGSEIRLTYAEALYAIDRDHPDLNRGKKHRDSIDGMEIRGVYDIFIPDGGDKRQYSPLWYRAFRYLQLDITTGNEPLVINDLYPIYAAYPFDEVARFESSSTLYDRIWEVGWRTARLCAQETYYDCPYYEQLQYVGDTRIQALVSLYVSGDDRLMRKALRLFDVSRIHEGITHSRYPSYSPQFIPPYSLFWINMVHDYYMFREDPGFIKGFLPGIAGIIEWHNRYLDHDTGMLGAVPYWNFVDWTEQWPWDNSLRIGGVPEGGITGNSSILTLQYAYALNEASALMAFAGDDLLASAYKDLANDLNKAVMKHAWSAHHGLIAETPDKTSFSQHANIMGVMSGALTGDQAREVIHKVINDKSLIQATMYFRFYLFLAMELTGYAGILADQLYQWEDMLAIGLTTFAEKPEPTRSDCHAWSASPLYFFLATMAGIKPAEPGFKSVVIEPNPGSLERFDATMPHPNGMIKINASNTHLPHQAEFTISLPDGLSGIFKWDGKVIHLEPGEQKIIASQMKYP